MPFLAEDVNKTSPKQCDTIEAPLLFRVPPTHTQGSPRYGSTQQRHFRGRRSLITVRGAAELLLSRIACVEDTETVDFTEAGRAPLAQPLAAPIDLPGFDNSAVDGYAVRFSDISPQVETVLAVAGRVAAGQSLVTGDVSGKAVRIFTGAAIPDGMDTVFMQEDCRVQEKGSVILPAGLRQGANRRLRGEDIRVGEEALSAGAPLPEDLGLAAALGVNALTVRRKLKAAIFSTGDEIVSPGDSLGATAVYDANRFMLHGLLRRRGIEVTDLGI